MYLNHARIAWRLFSRNKALFFINVAGLALGLTCFLFIGLWVNDEKKVDHFGDAVKNLYTVFTTTQQQGKTDGIYASPAQFTAGKIEFLAEDIVQKIPGVIDLAYYATGYDLPWGHPETLEYGDRKFKLNGSRASASFFRLFPFPLLEGSAQDGLSDRSAISISRKCAELLFGSPKNALGKTVRYENRINFTIHAVFENLPVNSSLQFDFLINWEQQRNNLEWSSGEVQQFVQLKPGTDIKKTVARLNQMVQARLTPNPGVVTTLGLQPFRDRYLFGQFDNGRPVTGRIVFVRIFSGVAIFILLIACINFMNLTTAASVKRGREIGVRKVIGSTRKQLVSQFLGEAVIYAGLGMMLSLALLFLLLPGFNHLTGKSIVIPVSSPVFWLLVTGVTLLTGLVAGSYPAIYLSSLEPVRTLKAVIQFTQGSILFRKSLTIFQFVLSVTLIICTVVVYRQTNFVEHTALGYDRSNLIYIRIEGELSNRDKYLLFKQKALHLPGVQMVDRTSEVPHSMDFVVDTVIHWQDQPKGLSVGFKPASVGFDFVKLMNLSIVQGRDFSNQFATDSNDAFLVNEEAIREMGLKEPLGKWISAWAKRGHIVGVLKDFHTASLREPIKPVILDVKEGEYFGVILVKIRSGQSRQALAGLESIYKNLNPGFAFGFQFTDEEYKKMYANDFIISRLSILFSVLAIGISCLGLLGLVLFTTEQKIKEIGIRKVLGASIRQILSLFARKFLEPIVMAILIAWPIGWLCMFSWLQDFAYRISLSWWIFGLAGFGVVLIAIAIMSMQVVRAASRNPVTSLRDN